MSDIFGGPPEDQFGLPWDYPEVEDPYNFWGGNVPDNYWWNTYTIENDEGIEYDLSVNQWFAATMTDPEITERLYGMHPLEIIDELMAAGVWDDGDWDTWRSYYEQTAG